MADAIDWSKGTLTPPPGAAPAAEPETDWSKGEMTPPAGLLRRAGDLGLGLAKGIIGVPEALVGVADLPTLGYAGKVAEGLGFRPKEAKAMLDEFKSPEQKAADAKVQQADGFFPTLGAMVQNPSTILGAAAESAPSMLGGGLIGRGVGAVVPRLGGVARGAIGEGAIAAGQNAEQVRQETADGLLTPTQAGVLAASGALTGAISLGAGSVARRLGIGDADTLLAGGTTPAPAQPKNWVRKVAEGFANEGLLEELPQSMQEQAAQNIAQGKPLLEGVGSAGAQGLLVGGLTGAVAGPLSGGEPAAVAPPPAPAPAPFSTALLGLPAPRTGPIVVGPNGEAMTSSQALDKRNQEDANLIARGATRGGFADVSGAGLGGYPMTEVAGRPAEVLPAAPAAAPALPPAQPATQPVTAALEAAAPLPQGPQAREAANLLYDEATETDRRIYDQVFGQQDVSDAQAREAGVQAPIEDFSNVPWDEPGNASEADFLRAMDPTLTDQEINDLIREADQAREQARPAQAARVDAAAAEAPAAGPARAHAGDSGGQEERGARAVAAPSPTNKPAAAPARRAPAAIDSGANADLGPMVEHTVAKSGKVLRGVIRTGLTPQQAKAIDPGAFRKGPGPDSWFLRERNAEQIRAWDAQQKPAAAPAPSGQAATNSVAPDAAPAPAPKPSSGPAAAPPAQVTANTPAAAAPALSPLTQAMNDLADVRARIEDQGQVVDDRLVSRERQLRKIVADLQKEAAPTGNPQAPEQWRVANPVQRREMLRGAGYTDGDQARVLSNTEWKDLDSTVRDDVRAAPPVELKTPGELLGDLSKATQSVAVKANTIFTEDAAAAARARMKKKLGTLNSGIDPELLQDGITLAGYHIEKGARTFAAYARAMLDDLGEAIRPHLKQIYLATKFDPRAGALASEMDGAAAVEAADLDAIPTEAPPAKQDLASLQQIANQAETPAPPARAATKSVAKPLYSQQRVAPESAQQIRAWAKAQGFPSVADDLHVTIGYSSAPVDASAVPLAPATTVQNSRARSVERLGDQGAVVLMLGSESSRTQQLAQAHQALRDAGASWDFPSYQPHITISYDAGGLDLSKVQPYGGPINLLAEERSDLDTSPSLPAETPAAAPAPSAAAPSAAAREVALSDRMYEAINAGRMPENNLQLRKMVEAIDGQAASAARMKQAQEALEAAIARVARDVVKEGRGATNDNGRATFDQLLALYERQPLLNVRTSTSVANQAYSTPAPLAFLASELARIGRGVTVYEPSAGTGMLLMGATPSNVAANELDPARQALLREAGFPVVTPNDATDYVPKGRFDAVITNPPFGSIKNDKGDTIKVPVDGYKLGQIDHLIAARALEAMKDDGRAVLILGANKVAGGVSNDDLIFFNWLYGRYNVAGHFEVSGDLYQRQGAGWPVRVITINGRQASAQVAPAPGTIQRAQGWEQVYAYFNDSLGASEQRPIAGASAGPVGAGTGAPAAGRVQRPAGGEAAEPGGQRQAGSPASAGNVPGAVPGVVADRGGRPGGAVGAGFDEQRINAEPVFPDRLEAAGNGGAQPARAEPARNPGTDGGLASAENQFQATYVPRSGRKDANVLIPVNMQQPLQDALSVLEDAVGDIDQYAARELGYASTREMHQALMGLQVDSVASAIYQMDQKGKAVIIADQCVAAGTMVYDPIAKTHTAIEVLAARGKPINVLALTHAGLRPAAASAPFRKGRADLFKVTMEDGRSITVTRNHRFLSSAGWTTLADGLSVGQFLACAAALPGSSSASALSARDAGDRHCTETPQGSTARFDFSAPLCGARPLDGQEAGQAWLPSPVDVLARTRLSSGSDGLATSQARSHRHQSSGRPSKSSSSPWASLAPSPTTGPAHACAGKLSAPTRQSAQPSVQCQALLPQGCVEALAHPHEPRCGRLAGASLRLPASGAVELFAPKPIDAGQLIEQIRQLGKRQEGLDGDESFAEHTGWLRVASISFISNDEFFDMWVPGHENYVADGFVNHNTGIGKGRQAAAIIRWAKNKGHVPVFMSMKPSLFTDMYGDLRDIGTTDVVPFIVNSDGWVSSADGEKLFANRATGHRNTLAAIRDTGELPAGTNAVFLTYSQINTENVQREALSALAPRAVFILDESHNAGGESNTGDFMRNLLEGVRGVTYLSATYAKRPDNMPLYFRTDIGSALSDTDSLMDAMASGGLPLQTVVSNNLVKAGQMFRRERSYDGVEIRSEMDTANRAEHERLSDATTQALRAIVDADRMFHEVYVKEMDKELRQQGAKAVDNAGNKASAGVQHTEFSSVVHNFVKQMLLGLKAQGAADRAIAALKRGEKPILAVENTMGSFLAEYAANNALSEGDSLGSFDYRTVLSRALARSRVINIQTPTGDKRKETVSLAKLDPVTRRAYEQAQQVIDSLDIDIPVSPIDWMRNEIRKAGYSVAEITGRNLTVDYSARGNPVLSQLDQQEQRDKVRSTRLFNGGQLDALILNVSGSTGISLHASEKFADQRQRHMIVVQPASDINVFMQMLGRIHRTGQVALPRYTLMAADLPTEKRPTALLSKKMKSLNANTSSNTESATSVQSFDMLNKYGDQVVGQYLADNPALLRSLGLEAGVDADGKGIEDIARKATGRLALQSIRTQEAFYAEVEGQYSALINYLNETGQNDLEPRTLDFEARELRQEVLHQGENPDTPFGADSIYGEYSIKAQGKPMKPAEVKAAMSENLEGKTGPEHTAALIKRLDADFTGFAATLSADQSSEADMRRAQGRNFIASHGIGQGFRVDINGDTFNAVVTNLRSTHRAGGNPYSLSKVQVTLAIAGPLRSITVPATQFGTIEVSTTPRANVDQLFRDASTEGRETAKIITGNLLAAYGELQGVRGTIVSFSKADGTVEQGILLPKTFTLENNTRQDVRMPTGEAAVRFLHESTNENIGKFGINTRDSAVRVLPLGTEGVEIRVPKSKARGAKYFLDRALLEQTGDFVTEGAAMVARVEERAKAAAALEVIGRKQALYALPSMAEEARAITATSLSAEQPATRQDVEARPAGGYAVNTQAANAERTLKANRLKSALQASTGNTDIQFKAVEPGDVGPVMAQALAAVRSTASRLFGHDVVFVQFDEGSPKLFNGAANRGIPDTVFLRIDSARPHMAIVGHELTHALRTSNPGLYQQLADRLGKLYKSDAGQQYFSRLKAVYDSAGIPLPRDVNEELVSDIVGDNFMDPSFWAAMSTQGQPGPFRMLVQAVLRFIDRLSNLMTGARPFGTQQYLDDLAAARAAVVEAMAEFSAQRSAKERGILAATPASAAQAAINSVAPAMSAEGDAPTLFSLTADPAALQQRAREVTADLFNTPGKLGWWHKTVGTPYNLAQRSPAFKKVFDGVQDFLKDVSAFATEAADLAPRILPKLESLADLKKQPLSAADTQAISRPIFEGTLTWGRDESGRPVQMAALEARYADMSSEQKAGLMLRRGLVAENELKRWKALPIDSYEGAVRNRFEATVLKPGVVWKDDELRSMFNLNDQQVSLYREFRQAIDKSVSNLALSDIVRFAGKDGEAMRGMVMDAASVDDGAILMRDHLLAMADADPRRGDILRDTANRVMDKADRANDLMKRGYAPLSRFGNYTVDVVGKDGERQYFGMFESRFEAGQMARKMQANFPDATVQQGTVSQESYKLFQGVTPETLELFGDMLGLEAQGDDARHQAFQQYLKAAKSNRSAMKRLIERKGIAGFSEDAGRVLAGFVYSNARQTSSNLHQGNIRESAAEVSKQSGELKDAAIRLTDYVSNPQEEAGGFRGLLFAQYIGGSIASAMVNLTQPLQTTLPYLSQFGGIRSAAKHVRQGVQDALKGKTGDVGLDRALKLAEERGIVSPQEVHHLMAQARGAATLQAGDGTRLGDAKAIANNAMSRLQLGWGRLFSVAEQFNRRVTFIAAYRQARENGDANPMAAAEKAVNETQFVANKGNRPRWARGAVGATLFTFKSYSVNYLELMARMAQNGPEGRRAAALMLATLMLMGGAGGLPFADDLGDLIDGLMQRLGFAWSTKQKRQEFLQSVFGEAGGMFVEKGVSGISGMPLDVSGRMGMSNMIPGTGLFQKKQDYARDVTELFGPAGDFAKRAFQAAGQTVEGKPSDAAFSLSPRAVANLRQGVDMAATGMYRDQRGRKVVDSDGWDAITKSIGFNPNAVARVQEATFEQQSRVAQVRLAQGEISDMWAAGIAEKDPQKIIDAQQLLRDWNERNKESPIRIRPQDVQKKVRTLMMGKEERIAKTAPSAIRASVREQLARENLAP